MSIREDEAGSAVELSIHIAARPETIFRYLTDPERFSRWIDAAVTLEAEVGGAYRIDFARSRTVVAGRVLELVSNERVVLSWGVESGAQVESIPVGATTVSIVLAATAEGTDVTLRHDGLPSDDERRDHALGWRGYLEQLSNRVLDDTERPQTSSRSTRAGASPRSSDSWTT